MRYKSQWLTGAILTGKSGRKNLLSYPANTLEVAFCSLRRDIADRMTQGYSHV